MSTEYERAGELIQRYQGGLTQTAVAELVNGALKAEKKTARITQGMVSSHRKGQKLSLELCRAYVVALNIPEREMIAALGYPSAMTGGKTPGTLEEFIERDPTLSKAAKEHLINQYGLLRLASAQERAGKPVLKKGNPGTRRKRTG